MFVTEDSHNKLLKRAKNLSCRVITLEEQIEVLNDIIEANGITTTTTTTSTTTTSTSTTTTSSSTTTTTTTP